jgi:hypothetical protein
MAIVCREIQEWIEEQVEQPIEEWENRQEQRCREEDCNWWTLCLNKLFCWLVVVVVKVVRWVLVTVGKWVVRTVCEVVSLVLDIVGAIVSLVLSIPILGGIIRTVWNWLLEIVWRLVGLLDFIGSWIGIRPRKKMYFGVVIPVVDGRPLATEAQMQPQVDAAIAVYDRLCNIDMVFTGFCRFANAPPDDALTVGCDAGGFFSDWWIAGSYFEFASLGCKYEDGWRRALGYGAQLIGFVVRNVTPDSATSSTIGCSMGPTHNYVVVEIAAGSPMVLAHEIGHACGLPHDDDSGNLMFASDIAAVPTLSALQIAVVRNSRHCTFI